MLVCTDSINLCDADLARVKTIQVENLVPSSEDESS